jgi:hypothetical protein
VVNDYAIGVIRLPFSFHIEIGSVPLYDTIGACQPKCVIFITDADCFGRWMSCVGIRNALNLLGNI